MAGTLARVSVIPSPGRVNIMKNFTFNIRWKEELDGFVDGHRFTVEITMGSLHVYFPSERIWESNAPAWAKGMWPAASEA